MMVWPILGGMTLVALVLVLIPMMWRREASADRHAHEIEVYKAQLRELERDVERGVLGASEAEGARLEIQRRMLAADAARDAPLRPLGANAHLTVTVGLLIGLPLVAGGTYAVIGRPDLPAAPLASRQLPEAATTAVAVGAEEEPLPSVENMVGQLEARTDANPEDPEAWFRLGRAYGMTGRHQDAAEAFRRTLALEDGLAVIHASLGEALTLAADGIVTEPAQEAFARALELDPDDPRARFYIGLAQAQRGDQRQALASWAALWADSPPDAPWLESLKTQGAALASEIGEDPDALFPPKAGAPDGVADAPAAEDLQALQAALDADPKDWEGWLRLARGYAGAGDSERARAALDRGREAYAGAPFVLQQFDQAAAELGLAGDGPAGGGPPGADPDQVAAIQEMPEAEQQEMIRGMVEGLAARLESQPDDLEGWLMLGRSWSVLGENDKAISAFQRAASMMPAGSSERAEIEAVIDELANGS